MGREPEIYVKKWKSETMLLLLAHKIVWKVKYPRFSVVGE